VEEVGLLWHSASGPYWNESAFYEFTAKEIDTLEAAANELQTMCIAAAQHVIDNKRYTELAIPAAAIPVIELAWEQEPPALYGRFDFMYDGSGPPKLLEYNADTPTSLMEAAVIQWSWLEEVFQQNREAKAPPQTDQFNSIHERLIAKWKDIAPYLSKPVYFASTDTEEDMLTTTYLRDTADQAGVPTEQMLMEEIGWDDDNQRFVDNAVNPIFSIFKLYPWEAMLDEEFGPAALATYQEMRWIEPIWKMLLSNKGILPILWELYPNHKNLLEAYSDGPRKMQSYVKKPLLSREGSNITMTTPQQTVETDGPYGEDGYIYQALAPVARFGDRYPVLGLWMIDQECGGMGIRESGSPITDNLSSFIPHYFR